MSYFDSIREYLDKKDSLQCVPVKDKAPFIQGWQDIEVTPEVIDSWEENFTGIANGFGVRAGQHNIGYLDIDTDDPELIYKIEEIMDLANTCVKRGMKGKTVFFRFDKEPKKSKYNVKLRPSDKKPVAEFNFTSGQTVLPPSIHPQTGVPYKWISQPLLEVDIEDLPIIDEDKIPYLEEVLRAPSLAEGLKNVPTSVTGDGSGKWQTITSEASRLLHMGLDETSIVRTLIGIDRNLFSGNQFFHSKKIGKCLIGDNDVENATLWVTEYKFNIMRQDPELRATLMSVASSKEAVPTFLDWKEPKELLSQKRAIEFPEDLFPSSTTDYCKTLSRLSAIPAEAYLAGLMTAFSACAQGKVIINAKWDFVVRPSISSMIVAPSGSRKDSVFDWSKLPLKKLIERDKRNFKENHLENEKLITEKLIDIDKKTKKAISEGDSITIDELKKEKIALQGELVGIKAHKSNFIFESGTQERLYKLMEENQHRGIFICASEFVQMMGVMSKKGNEALRAFLLKLFNGSVSESFSHQTVGGVSVDIDKVFGCSLTSVQTDVLAGLFRAVNSGNNNDGFIQRFFLIPINPEIKRMEKLEDGFDTSRIDNMFALIYDHKSEIHVTFEDEEAYNAYIEYDVHIRERSQQDVSYIKSFKNKYSGQSIKLAWIIAQLDAPPGVIVNKISKKYFMKAIAWLEWQERVLNVTYSNVTYDDAVKYANQIIKLHTENPKLNQSDRIMRELKGSMNLHKEAMDLLVDNNFLRRVGGVIEFNPRIIQ